MRFLSGDEETLNKIPIAFYNKSKFKRNHPIIIYRDDLIYNKYEH
jgi:hypothetical protein